MDPLSLGEGHKGDGFEVYPVQMQNEGFLGESLGLLIIYQHLNSGKAKLD